MIPNGPDSDPLRPRPEAHRTTSAGRRLQADAPPLGLSAALLLTWAGCAMPADEFALAYERERCWYLRQCEGDRFDAEYEDMGACTTQASDRAEATVGAFASCTYDDAAARTCFAWMHKLVDSCMDHTREVTAESCDVVWRCEDGEGGPGVP
jgi:hypothetical protein